MPALSVTKRWRGDFPHWVESLNSRQPGINVFVFNRDNSLPKYLDFGNLDAYLIAKIEVV